MSSRFRLNRRHVLRGLFGTALALPLLEATEGAALAQSQEIRRFVHLFGGFSLGVDNDPAPNVFVPEASGFVLTEATQPLGPIRDLVTMVSGLSIPLAKFGEPTPPAGRGAGVDSFHFHVNPFVSGLRQVGDSFSVEVTGPSADQRLADAIGSATRFGSLTLRSQNPEQGLDFIERSSLSFREVAGRVSPVEPETSPRRLYEALTTGIEPLDPGQAAARRAELSRRRSVLDFVDRRMAGDLDRLGTADRQRIDAHFTAIRELEQRLATPLVTPGGVCPEPTDPGPDPSLDRGFVSETLRAEHMVDLLHLAFACDLTRVATMMMSTWQSIRDVSEIVTSPWDQHGLHHGGRAADLIAVVRWHLEVFARFVQRLEDTPEGDGSLLDRTVVLFSPEGGYGPFGDSPIDNPMEFSSHSTEDMAVLVAGRAGGLRPGRRVEAPRSANHPANVAISALQAAGLPTETHGEVSGAISELF